MKTEQEIQLIRLARNAVHNALRRKVLIRPAVCSQCHRPCKPQAHHPDYNLPLEVIWLCKRCHTAEHYPDRPFKPESRAAYYREYHEKNREKRRLESRAYKAAHPEFCATIEKNWRVNNQDKVKESWKLWSEKNRSSRAEYLKQYAKENRDKLNALRRERRHKKQEESQ